MTTVVRKMERLALQANADNFSEKLTQANDLFHTLPPEDEHAGRCALEVFAMTAEALRVNDWLAEPVRKAVTVTVDGRPVRAVLHKSVTEGELA